MTLTIELAHPSGCIHTTKRLQTHCVFTDLARDLRSRSQTDSRPRSVAKVSPNKHVKPCGVFTNISVL
jgi:hypothetical protein